MDAQGFDTLARQVSRRGIVALLGGGLLARPVHEAGAEPSTCGGAPNIFTRHCKHAGGSCETDTDCAAGCVCTERRQGCCYATRKRKRGRGRGPRRCIDGAPGLYCTPTGGV